VFFLNREEAAAVIKELLMSCKKMDEVFMCMVPPTGDTPIVTQGYQIHIKVTTFFGQETLECIEAVMGKYKLSAYTINDKEKMIIYRKQ
jgi:hypothetical protein